ncbi:acetoacetyl-CoA reductase [Caballeronia sordidicola]|uniref:Acetoacetyl-CoA reductase n=1 Tax=Caballeronia sordidicola TaxID=196367 RepID=A0A158I7R7_CABSO|nr:3-oxoacyl-ACP reductase [Caballeronia sordidicola]SAL52151.1 acetoacetyl-CoA reductase [Caballeronia sordidicola]
MPRTALVTGGVSGIGSATAVSLKDAGYAVIVNYFGNDAEAEEFHAKTAIPVFNWNVADFEATQAAIGGIVATSGPIEILVNNAGITRDSMLHKMTLDQWRSVIDVDLGGCFNACRAVISSMRERRFGRIGNISSVNALSGQFGQTNYAAAKAGIIGFTKALALEGASRGITANVIAPGYTDTGMVNRLPDETLRGIVENVPAKRLASPEEIARGVLFLVADDSSFINGATLSINGGKYMA